MNVDYSSSYLGWVIGYNDQEYSEKPVFRVNGIISHEFGHIGFLPDRSQYSESIMNRLIYDFNYDPSPQDFWFFFKGGH
jgi:hypothetical protein